MVAMKAITCRRYGSPDVLRLEDLPTPEPVEDQLRIKVAAVAVTSGDVKVRSFANIPLLFWLPARLTFGLFRPRHPIPGENIAGTVEAVGANVTKFKVGDRVFGFIGFAGGGCAEYVCVKQDAAIGLTPEGLSDVEAAATPFGAMTAHHFLTKAAVKAGEQVLIYGASGAVGIAAVQLAKHLDTTVTGVCSGKNVERVRDLGADRVLDYTAEEFTQAGQMYDVIFDTVGKTTYRQVRPLLNAGGR